MKASPFSRKKDVGNTAPVVINVWDAASNIAEIPDPSNNSRLFIKCIFALFIRNNTPNKPNSPITNIQNKKEIPKW